MRVLLAWRSVWRFVPSVGRSVGRSGRCSRFGRGFLCVHPRRPPRPAVKAEAQTRWMRVACEERWSFLWVRTERERDREREEEGVATTEAVSNKKGGHSTRRRSSPPPRGLAAGFSNAGEIEREQERESMTRGGIPSHASTKMPRARTPPSTGRPHDPPSMVERR